MLAVLGFASWLEGVGIAVAVLLATMVATYSEYKNEQSFQKLQLEAGRVVCNVYRYTEKVTAQLTRCSGMGSL